MFISWNKTVWVNIHCVYTDCGLPGYLLHHYFHFQPHLTGQRFTTDITYDCVVLWAYVMLFKCKSLVAFNWKYTWHYFIRIKLILGLWVMVNNHDTTNIFLKKQKSFIDRSVIVCISKESSLSSANYSLVADISLFQGKP